ncbi:phosphatase PAP2 family protein [Streptomyces sp. NBC_01387]|uniref:phosphatase PAP2 family protein n=1 Tax=unclassified Streptomyces TaxID=2593676 RepID=UPI002024008A|nr:MULTISPECIES: phosphatase PAP2 family protein [unclassified Streptomyces]MCX4549118.1 phosphatase PAP2 family protein [Streptomyces sp. NBC_01500]WSC20695.1 phosphatase PAP2 family protein [Streptomyces sp. NBC_01766]WSV54722.1 phosphatase PAP2 family protein [Streptomyces sp. NBC_01014]
MDSSSQLYKDILEFAHSTPSWVQQLMELWTEAGLLLFAVLFVVVWWRARTRSSQAMSLALLAPLGTAIAYVISEVLKSVIHEERPCRAVSGAMRPLIDCPAPGDWSFPSNHSIIAASAAVGLSLAMVRLVWLTVPVALLMAFSRVFVGVHYPHDVIVGLLLGALVALLVSEFLTRPVRSLVETMRTSDISAAAWFVGPGLRS